MIKLDFKFFDTYRERAVPVCVYLPSDVSICKKVVVFSHGYQDQQMMSLDGNIPGYKKYQYLAEFFTDKNYAFISIQHDLIGDKDGLETIDLLLVQHEAREHLYKRGIENILFVLNEMRREMYQLEYNQFIICGHSNGGDISKYFANKHPEMVTDVIVLDGRRCRIEGPMRILMFEANDTMTDEGVIPQDTALRSQIDLIVVKPQSALHKSYCDDSITVDVQKSIYIAINYFLYSGYL